jgi:DNA-binding LacI/PurR family transcriptional regulator
VAELAGRLPTLTDVARVAGVSRATASRVLAGSDHPVRPETRQRVLMAARQVGYVPNEIARSLIRRRSLTVGLIIPDITNSYYAELVGGVEEVVRPQGFSVLLANTGRDPGRLRESVKLFGSRRVDGLIIAGGGTDEGGDSMFPELPVVTVGRHRLPYPTVEIDNRGGAFLAVNHLLAGGRRRVACIAGPPDSTTVKDRLAGYLAALEQAGVVFRPELVRFGDFRPTSGYELTRALLTAHPEVDGIFAHNDRMAIGALAALADLGYVVPGQVGVVGFDDIVLASFVRPALTTVRVRPHRIGVAAAELLLKALRGEPHPDRVLIETELVIRSSS